VTARTWLTDTADLPAYLEVRKEFVTHRPAYMLAVVPQMVRADLRVEIEILAAVPPRP
jgi:enamine deaminase RidA (YjgF/YER057c/UK114 family)